MPVWQTPVLETHLASEGHSDEEPQPPDDAASLLLLPVQAATAPIRKAQRMTRQVEVCICRRLGGWGSNRNGLN